MSNHREAAVLTRLTYASRTSANVDEAELKAILSKAQKNNALMGITGMLFFNKQYFLQSIEGPRTYINQLLMKLMADNRHYDLQILESIDIETRIWPQWAMNYATPSKSNTAIYLKYSNTTSFNPFLLSASAATNFLNEMKQKH